MGTQMSVEAGAQERDMATVRIPISLPFRNCGNDKSGSFAEAEAYHSFYRKLARGHFNPRAPRGALPIASWAIFPLVLVSTHAPREGRDTPPPTAVIAPTSFNPRAPMGRDRHPQRACRLVRCFNPRAPLGRDEGVVRLVHDDGVVSTHAPQWGATRPRP